MIHKVNIGGRAYLCKSIEEALDLIQKTKEVIKMEKKIMVCKEYTINPTTEHHCGDCFKWHLADREMAETLRIENTPDTGRFVYCDIFNKALPIDSDRCICRLPECKKAEVAMDEDETLEVIKAYYFHAYDMERKWSAICGNPPPMIKFNDLLANHAKMMLWRGRAQAFKRSMNILLGNKEEDRWEDE